MKVASLLSTELAVAFYCNRLTLVGTENGAVRMRVFTTVATEAFLKKARSKT
jgi:hypothetical protein